MVAEVFSAMIQGIEGQIVKIQVDISNGLPNFNMIGYLSNEVKESKERVRTALNNIGVLLPPKRISVNFAPAGNDPRTFSGKPSRTVSRGTLAAKPPGSGQIGYETHLPLPFYHHCIAHARYTNIPLGQKMYRSSIQKRP